MERMKDLAFHYYEALLEVHDAETVITAMYYDDEFSKEMVEEFAEKHNLSKQAIINAGLKELEDELF